MSKGDAPWSATTGANEQIGHPGDMAPETFRASMHRVADMVADYLEGLCDRRVTPDIAPGDFRSLLPTSAPEQGESIDAILDDFDRLITPNTTHWNHPGFMGYFAVTGSGPGVLGEALAASLNVNAMLWRTGPAQTELELHVCDWLRQAMGLPAEFSGNINDTASISSFLAIAAARHRADSSIRRRGMTGRDLPRFTVYASEHAHSSIDKACVTLGIGLDNLRKIPGDSNFRMDAYALDEAVKRDRAAGFLPIAVVATVGTTSTTSIDPVQKIADIARDEDMWLHVDGAYGGSGALLPELREKMPGLELADSIVVNPHKWLFVPCDCSVLFVRDRQLLRETFSIVPEYLKTNDGDAVNLMDYGVQLGRRFRALKLWMVLRSFGLEGLRERMRFQCGLAREFAGWVSADPRFEVCAPVPMTTVCFRAVPDVDPERQDALNERLLAEINAAREVYLSHSRLNGRYVLRMCVGNLRATQAHIGRVWELAQAAYERAVQTL